MLMRPLMFRGAVGGGAAVTRPQDVHSTTLYTGNNTTRELTLGFRPDLTNFKSRGNDSGVGYARLTSLNNFNTVIRSNTSDGQGSGYSAFLSSTATGVRIVNDGAGELNNTNNSKVLWADKQAPNYLQIRTFTHNNGTADTFDMAVLGVVGEVTVKRTDDAGDWYVWHRSIAAGNNLRLNTTAVPSSTDAFVSVSGTTVTFSADAPSGSYYFEAWAHDPDTTNGIIQCGSFPGNGSGQGATLGWQPQLVQWKRLNVAESWNISDVQRGFGPAFILSPNLSAAEPSANNGNLVVSSTGFYLTGGGSGPYAFRAIRAAY